MPDPGSFPRESGSGPAPAAVAVTHRCPTEGSGLMPCCGRTPFEAGRSDRMTMDGTLVTCNVVPFPEAGKAPPRPPRPPHERWRPVYPEGWERALEAAHDTYMDRLRDGAERGDCGDGLDAYGVPFCGCEACERRASWMFLMAWVMDAFQDGEIALEERRYE